MAYAYKPLHHPMAHAFTNTFLYLDWDRKGFPYPVIPFAINCYGRNLIHAKGGLGHLFAPPRPADEGEDPPSPHPWRCMDVGAAVAEVLARSPYRVALIASSSWSHASCRRRTAICGPTTRATASCSTRSAAPITAPGASARWPRWNFPGSTRC